MNVQLKRKQLGALAMVPLAPVIAVNSGMNWASKPDSSLYPHCFDARTPPRVLIPGPRVRGVAAGAESSDT